MGRLPRLKESSDSPTLKEVLMWTFTFASDSMKLKQLKKVNCRIQIRLLEIIVSKNTFPSDISTVHKKAIQALQILIRTVMFENPLL